MNTIEARDAEVGDSTEEEPTEHGDWFAPTDDWEEIWEEFEKKDDVWIGIAVVVLIIGLFGLAANSQIFLFYWSRRKDLVPSLYLALSSTDFVVSLTAIMHFAALLVLVEEKDSSTAIVIFLGAVFAITTLILRISVFVNVILIVVRTINITRPFYQIQRKGMWLSLLICILLLLPIILYDTIRINQQTEDFLELKVKYIFLPYVGDFAIQDIVVAVNDLQVKSDAKKRIDVPQYVTFLTSCAPFIVAVLISLTCLAINYRQLRANKIGLSKTGGGAAERDITRTITILTILFSVCNTVYTVWLTLTWVLILDVVNEQTLLQVSYTTSSIFPFISSALNAIILIWRSRSLKQSLKSKICGRTAGAQRSGTSSGTMVTNLSQTTKL